ncbi:hypothetical protein ACFW1A_00845 [Kitasatospora sp. NPDC058965]|uniref:hypothetical protein n=1 Tax=Kitasatospora sp. NPDC058965 TaxID=3346682 RepID=UPI0036B4FF82
MRQPRTALAAIALGMFGAALGAPADASSLRDTPHQSIYLHATAGDNSSDGVADISVTEDRGGYRIHGYVEAVKGCMTLKGVEMHLGTYLGGDTISHVCGEGRKDQVDAWTHHSEIVLSAEVPHGFGRDSSIVTLTGR